MDHRRRRHGLAPGKGPSQRLIGPSGIHQTLKVTPAMAAGVAKRLWEMTDLVEMLEAWEESGKLVA